MKTSLLPLLVGASFLVLPSVASAALLVGYHTFGSTVDSTPNEWTLGFSGVLSSPGGVGGATGSFDDFYGPDSVGAGGVSIAGASNDNGRLTHAGNTTLTVTNGTTSSYTLTSLLFDSARAGSEGVISVSYTKAPVVNSPLITNATVGVPAGPINTQNYTDHIAGLAGIILGVGQSITFTWSATDNVRLDNIALIGELSAIPEPGSLLALGALVGSGALLRSRRRAPVALA